MTLLSRVAEHLYWGARYLERAEDTARIVRSYTDLIVDLPFSATSTWAPLLAVAGLTPADVGGDDEELVIRYLVVEPANPGSVASSVTAARDNLRTTREVLPREAWQAVNDLYLYVRASGDAGVARRTRSRLLSRVIDDALRVDGVLSTSMSRDEAYEMWRLGQAIERADMTTRVLGVRAAELLGRAPGAGDDHGEVQWMGLLRSLSALQMYHRATRGPIEGASAVHFLLFDERFPRSVTACVRRIRMALEQLPRPHETLPYVDAVVEVVGGLGRASGVDGAELDTGMDELQRALGSLHEQVLATYVRPVAP